MFKALRPGSVISLIAPARKVSREEMQPAIKMIEAQGYHVKAGKNLYSSYHQWAGTDEQRLEDFQHALDDPETSAILFARGGYGTVRLIDKLDFTAFLKNPKWLIGFSDLTVIHSHVPKHFQIPTLHAPMAITFPKADKNTLDKLWAALGGENYTVNFDWNDKNRAGSASGVLCGGNLSVLYSLLGSASDLNTDGKILFLEDLDEYLYHIDRMMMAMKRAGKLSKLKALVIGGMTEMKDNTIPFGFTAEEIIRNAVNAFDFPLCFGFPAGHIDNNTPLIMGAEVHLNIETSGCEINFINPAHGRT